MEVREKTDSPQEKIRRVILHWLTRRDYSQHEITQKLKSKGYSSEDFACVVADLAHAGLINEARFTESYIYWRRGKGLGPLRISMELQSRGISAEMIAEHLEITDNAWFTQAQNVWRKHFKGGIPADFKSRAKQMRFLQYRGFTREQIESVFGKSEWTASQQRLFRGTANTNIIFTFSV